MKNYLKSTLKGLTADYVRRKNKTIKTVYSQKLNKIMKSKESAAGTNYLYKPKLVWFDCDLFFGLCFSTTVFRGMALLSSSGVPTLADPVDR
jgi:hypothetical protein